MDKEPIELGRIESEFEAKLSSVQNEGVVTLESKLRRNADDKEVSKFIKDTFKKRKCNRFRSETTKNEPDLCECGYSKNVHSREAIQNIFDRSQPLTKTLETDAFGKLDYVEDAEEESNWNNIHYVRLDYETDVSNVSELFNRWKMRKPNIIISVISDGDGFAHKGNEIIESTFNGSVQTLMETTCRRLVEAATSTNAWIITGGLNIGVDQMIGDEVDRRLASDEKIPQAVIGISHWGCLGETKSLLSEPNSRRRGPGFDESHVNPTGLSLNPHHTHFLLVDDGTQKSGCECKLRRKVELYLSTKTTNAVKNCLCTRLVYVLIGGSISAFHFVKHALANRIPVLIATGTGGAADIISRAFVSKDRADLENVQEIAEKLFYQLEKMLVAKPPTDEVRKVITDAKDKTKLGLFSEIVKLLEIANFSEEDEQVFKDDVVKLLDGVKDLLICKQNPTNLCNRMCDVIIGQVLVPNGMPLKMARQTADDLNSDVLSDTLAKVQLVLDLLTEIKAEEQMDMLISFKATDSQHKSITDALNKDYFPSVHPRNAGLFILAADWDDESMFRKLLLDKWMSCCYQYVLTQLLLKEKNMNMNKYVELMMAHNRRSKWLAKSGGHLVPAGVLKGKKLSRLQKKVKNLEDKPHNEDRIFSLIGKMLFIWCVKNRKPETAMIFWKQGKDRLAMVLLAYYLSRKQKKKLVAKVGYEEMAQQKEFFAQHAINLLKTCYTYDPDKTYDLLIGKVEDIGDSSITPLDIAVKAKFTAFISLVPTQEMLNNIWVKDIKDHNKWKYIPMLLSEVCPLLAPALLTITLPSEKYEKYERNVGLTSETESIHQPEHAEHVAQDNSPNSNPQLSSMLNYFRRVGSFINTPLVKFGYGMASYIGYLILFSVVMLTDFRSQIAPFEIALSIWTLILLIEELKQVIAQKKEYKDFYNSLDIGAITSYIVGFILRMIYHVDPTTCLSCLYVARIILAFSLLIFFIRSLQFLWIHIDIGPKIYMMRRLIRDLISFMLIMVVFIAAYGVVSNIILYPNQPLNLDLLHDVFYDACWSVLQQFNSEETAGSKCENNVTAKYCSDTSNSDIDYVMCKKKHCPANRWIVSVILAFYALFTVIMLLNVLIAMFNATFTTITKNETGVSRLQRYRLIREYYSHPMIPTPLSAITYPYDFILYLCNLKNDKIEEPNQTSTDAEAQSKNKEYNCKMLCVARNTAFEMFLDPKIKSWERNMVVKYLKQDKESKERSKSNQRRNSSQSQPEMQSNG